MTLSGSRTEIYYYERADGSADFYTAEGASVRRSLMRTPIDGARLRSEEHTSELQSLMRISYAVFCLKNKHTTDHDINIVTHPTISHSHEHAHDSQNTK